MSVPLQPSDSQRRPPPPGANTPRDHAGQTGSNPPIIPEEDREDYPNPVNFDETCASADAAPYRPPRCGQPPRGKRLARQADGAAPVLTGEQRLLLLDTWRRSGLPAGDFAARVGISKHTLYAWKHKFEAEGPAGLEDKPRSGPGGSRLPEITRRAILMMKQDNPDCGCERISALLLRGPALLVLTPNNKSSMLVTWEPERTDTNRFRQAD